MKPLSGGRPALHTEKGNIFQSQSSIQASTMLCLFLLGFQSLEIISLTPKNPLQVKTQKGTTSNVYSNDKKANIKSQVQFRHCKRTKCTRGSLHSQFSSHFQVKRQESIKDLREAAQAVQKSKSLGKMVT